MSSTTYENSIVVHQAVNIFGYPLSSGIKVECGKKTRVSLEKVSVDYQTLLQEVFLG